MLTVQINGSHDDIYPIHPCLVSPCPWPMSPPTVPLQILSNHVSETIKDHHKGTHAGTMKYTPRTINSYPPSTALCFSTLVLFLPRPIISH